MPFKKLALNTHTHTRFKIGDKNILSSYHGLADLLSPAPCCLTTSPYIPILQYCHSSVCDSACSRCNSRL